VKKEKPSRLAGVLFLTLALVLVPSLAIALIGLGLVSGIVLAWVSRATTKL
jgi:nitrate reductase NapE component